MLKLSSAACAALIGLALVAGCSRARQPAQHEHGTAAAHDAHDHAPAEGPPPVVVTLFTDEVELFMEYPALVVGEPARFLAHWTVLATGEPVRAGSLEIEATSADGHVVRFVAHEPARDGLFIPAHTFAQPGTYRAQLRLDSPQIRATLELDALQVHPTAAAAAAAGSAAPDPPDAVPFLMEQQWKLGLLLDRVERRTLTRRLQLPGEIEPQHHAAAVVSAPVSGRLLRAGSAKLPQVGDSVQAGAVLALIEPPLPATEAAALSANRAQLQALDTELVLRSLDLGVKGLEVQRAFRQAEARLDFARRALARAEELRSKGVGSDQQYDQAQQDMQVAQAELDAAQATQRFYEESAARLRDVQARLESRGGPAAGDADTLQLPLVAPISGRIVEVESVEGEHVEALEKVYALVNLDTVWVLARISEFDLGGLADTPNASLELPALPGRRFDVRASGGRLVHIGTRVDPQTRTLPIRFELPNPEGVFRAGQFANVYLETQRTQEGVAVPESAIVLDNGRPLVYVLLTGEAFQRREVELGIRDNGWVEVLAGVQAGERVATRGAYAIKLASLSPASFGHGHGH